MKDSLIDPIKLLAKERRMIAALLLLALATLIFVTYVGLNLHHSELKLVTHYSAFGTTNFYRDSWYYLLTFVVFGIFLFVVHTIIALRLLALKGSELALGFLWVSVVMVFVATAIAVQVLRVAALA